MVNQAAPVAVRMQRLQRMPFMFQRSASVLGWLDSIYENRSPKTIIIYFITLVLYAASSWGWVCGFLSCEKLGRYKRFKRQDWMGSLNKQGEKGAKKNCQIEEDCFILLKKPLDIRNDAVTIEKQSQFHSVGPTG